MKEFQFGGGFGWLDHHTYRILPDGKIQFCCDQGKDRYYALEAEFKDPGGSVVVTHVDKEAKVITVRTTP